MLILGIESSCDESAASIVKNGREVLSNVLYSQINEHKDWGGVIPEYASRLHYEKIHTVIDSALKTAKVSFQDIDAIAVTVGPGLMGSLLIGVNVAQTLAWIYDKPLIPVNHLYGHICSNFIESDLEPPFLCMLVSGGHTQIITVNDYNEMEILGSSIDDAVGEAFDKTARLLGLDYPGGPELDKLAQTGSENKLYKFPISNVEGFKFSFSGLKTAVLRLKEKIGEEKFTEDKADIAFAFQKCIAETLYQKINKAIIETNLNTVVIAGGVSANSHIRKVFQERFSSVNPNETTAQGTVSKLQPPSCHMPNLKYCTDNAAMIASAGYFKFTGIDEKNREQFNNYSLNTFPKLI